MNAQVQSTIVNLQPVSQTLSVANFFNKGDGVKCQLLYLVQVAAALQKRWATRRLRRIGSTQIPLARNTRRAQRAQGPPPLVRPESRQTTASKS
jgi:hypothetical protein